MAVAADNVNQLKKNCKSYKRRTEPSAPYKSHSKSPKTLRAIGSSSSGAATITAAADQPLTPAYIPPTFTAINRTAPSSSLSGLSATIPFTPPVPPIGGETPRAARRSAPTDSANGRPWAMPILAMASPGARLPDVGRQVRIPPPYYFHGHCHHP